MRLPIALLSLAAFALAVSAHAAPVRTEFAEAELIAARDAAEPGKPLAVALRLKAKPGWHTYWRNPGDSGQPTSIVWRLPPGYAAGEIRWPVPQKMPIGPLANYGYKGEVLLATDVAVPAGASGRATLAASVRWLVCSPDLCIPETTELSLALPVGAGKPSAWSSAFERIRLPQPAPPADWKLAASRDGARVRLDIEGARAKSLAFFAFEEGKIEHAGAQPLERTASGVRLFIPLARMPVGELTRAAGVLVADGERAYEIDVPIAVAGAEKPAHPQGAPRDARAR